VEKQFDGKKRAKLGTEKNPAMVTVQTEARKQELASIFEENGWDYSIDVDPETPENIGDLEILSNPQKPAVAEPSAGRNDPCPCGSGKKYKKCCGK
jgi:SWIM/SEC-C metal-binding protein